MVALGRDLVQEACDRHKTAPTASAALGRALLGTLLLASFRAEGENTQVTFRGNGGLGQIQTVATAGGLIKGRVGNPSCDPPLRSDGKLAVGTAVGAGVLVVVRSEDSQYAQPYTGMTPLVTGEIAEDFAQYLADSEQINSAVGLGVSINRDASIRAAGGFIVQVLPFASEETLQQLERNLAALPSITDLLHEGRSAAQLTDAILGSLGTQPEITSSLTPRFGPCDESDLRHRMKRAVAALGRAELEDIIREEGKIEVECEFCRDKFEFTEKDILETLEA